MNSDWQRHVVASSRYLELGMLDDAALALEVGIVVLQFAAPEQDRFEESQGTAQRSIELDKQFQKVAIDGEDLRLLWHLRGKFVRLSQATLVFLENHARAGRVDGHGEVRKDAGAQQASFAREKLPFMKPGLHAADPVFGKIHNRLDISHRSA